jgi:hypothetical protein
LIRRQLLAVDHCLQLPFMPLATRIVEVGRDIQTRLSERQPCVVKVQQVGPVFCDQILT